MHPIQKTIATHFHEALGSEFDRRIFMPRPIEASHRQALRIFTSHFNCEISYSARSDNGALSWNLHFSVKLMKWSRHLCCIHVLSHARLLLFIGGQSRSADFYCSSFPFAMHLFSSSLLSSPFLLSVTLDAQRMQSSKRCERSLGRHGLFHHLE